MKSFQLTTKEFIEHDLATVIRKQHHLCGMCKNTFYLFCVIMAQPLLIHLVKDIAEKRRIVTSSFDPKIHHVSHDSTEHTRL